ncbi:FAD-dependent oxidoreductase, partial [uncultured Agrobacterium sp.]
VGADNLFLAGRVAGADAAAYGSLRVMGTAFVTGQAAGIAAALSASSASVSAYSVRKHLCFQNAII